MTRSDPADLLAAYDAQLRTVAPSAVAVTRLGPLHLVTYPWHEGWVSYRGLDGADAATIRGWVGQVLEHYRADPDIREVEWKACAHDDAPGLEDALVEHGFVAEDPETVMIGEATALAVDVPLPSGVTLRRIHTEHDVRRMAEMQRDVFGDVDVEDMMTALLHRQSLDDGMELWVAEHDGDVVSAGRLEPVQGTEFAGIWGGSTVAQWRHRGIYRALTAARATSALRLGKRLLQSDSSADSRPILEENGLVGVTTTTPWMRVLTDPGATGR